MVLLDIGLTEGQLLLTSSAIALSTGSDCREVGATIDAWSHLLLLSLVLLFSQVLSWIESLAALLGVLVS